MSNDETQGIYFTDNREDIDERFDMWEVDVRGLKLHPDETTDWPEGHVWWVTYDEVGPERLRLIYRGSGIPIRESFTNVPDNIAVEQYGGTKFYTFHLYGKEFVVGFKGDFNADEDDDREFYVSFTGDDGGGKQTTGLTNDNMPMRVLGSVAHIIESFISEHDPDQIDFSVETNQEKRTQVYDRILEYLSKKQRLPDGYEWDRDQNFNYYIFKDGYR